MDTTNESMLSNDVHLNGTKDETMLLNQMHLYWMRDPRYLATTYLIFKIGNDYSDVQVGSVVFCIIISTYWSVVE